MRKVAGMKSIKSLTWQYIDTPLQAQIMDHCRLHEGVETHYLMLETDARVSVERMGKFSPLPGIHSDHIIGQATIPAILPIYCVSSGLTSAMNSPRS